MTSPDLSQYLGVFLDEGQEQIELLERHLLEIEKTEPTRDVLQAMFRGAHTLKGSSRTMGFMAIGDLTHEMESVLEDLNSGRLAVSTDVVSSLLGCMDLLKSMMADIQQYGDDGHIDAETVHARVASLQSVRMGVPAAESAASMTFAPDVLATASQVQANGSRVVRALITVSDTCAMKSVRALMLLAALGEQGTVLGTAPAQADLDEERFDRTFEVLVETDLEPGRVQSLILGMSEIDAAQVSAFSEHQEAPIEKSHTVPTQTPHASTGTIRVAVSRLDALLNLVGELVVDRAQLSQIAASLAEIQPQSDIVSELNESAHRLARVTSELQDEIMKTRLLPVDGVFQRMPRMVRDVARKTGKEIDLVVSGGETELDRSLLDVLSDPVIHLLRNSVDHGIEKPEVRERAGKAKTGRVSLSARHEENQIKIEISDDGKGIDPKLLKEAAVKKNVLSQATADSMSDSEAIKLIFASGFSTAKNLSDISGRGVGMDIVRANIEKIGGRIQVDSEVGKGTRFTIHLPLTLAIVRALLVECGMATYALPLSSVVETLGLSTSGANATCEQVGGRAVLVLRGETIPLANLIGVLDGDASASQLRRIDRDTYVVIVGDADRKVGLCVDRLLGEQEVVVKPLGKLLGNVQGISGASILADGRVALIVDSARAVKL